MTYEQYSKLFDGKRDIPICFATSAGNAVDTVITALNMPKQYADPFYAATLIDRFRNNNVNCSCTIVYSKPYCMKYVPVKRKMRFRYYEVNHN
jgi:hypothetical protein